MIEKNRFLAFIICLLVITGCSNNKYSNYEHSTLESKNIYSYTFHDTKNTYALADYTDIANDEGGVSGLYYKINANDYILIDQIESCGNTEIYSKKEYNYFYSGSKNELYIVRCQGNIIKKYILDGSDYKIEDLTFDTLNISSNDLEKVMINYIDHIDNEYIYFKANLSNGDRTQFDIKCSLDNKKCVKIK